MPHVRARIHAVVQLVAVAILALFFANVEIQIEGPNGWASSLPVTFRIEEHWLLDIFWGSRPMTGYHAWVFPFMAMAFHFPMVWSFRWSIRLEARAIACISVFWIIEDGLWFVLNPAYGWAKLTPEHIPWHVHWFLGLPTDYWTFTGAALVLYTWSFWPEVSPAAGRPAMGDGRTEECVPEDRTAEGSG